MLCPHCARPLPTSLLDAALYLRGDPGLEGRSSEFAENLTALLLRGLEVTPGHRERLLDLYRERHAENANRRRAVGRDDV